MATYIRLLRNRPFVLLWLGQIVSRFGDVLYYAGMLWLVKELTHSNTVTGLAGMAMALPQLTGPLAGVLVDRWPRRTVLLASDLVRGVLVLTVPLLAWLGRLNAWGVITVVFALSLVSQAFVPAKQAIVPELVDEDGLVTANSLDTMAQSGMQVLGFLISGALIVLVGPVHLFTLDGLSFFISALFIALMGTVRSAARPQTAAPAEPPSAASRGTFWNELREGVMFLLNTPLTRLVIPAAVVINFVFGPVMVLLPSYATDILGAGAKGYGYLEGALAGGMLLGAALLPILGRKLSQLVTMTGGISLMGLSIVGAGFSSHLSWSLALMLLNGVTNAAINVTFLTLLQSMVPKQLHGRVFSSLFTLVSVASPLGLGLSGVLADRFSVSAVYIAAGLTTLAMGIVLVLPAQRVLADLQTRMQQRQAEITPDLA